MRFIITILVLAGMAGCSSELAVRKVTIDPPEPEVGGTATMMVTFKGHADQVASVRAVVEESSEIQYILNNNGENGDMKAGDKIWTYTVDVPYEAQPGTYHLRFVIRDVNGNEVSMEGAEGPNAYGTVAVTLK